MYRTTLAATLLAGVVALGAAAPAVACPPDHDHQGTQGTQGTQGSQSAPHSHPQGQSAEPIQAHTDPLKVSDPVPAMPGLGR
ncbi:hypothetical protein [Streptomyces sp. NPDC048172]|uniref:hypothetical protein n=1 Tax=Streptomyces sp. NPDC048172 TaxID=3365505 RepID=UPI003723CCD8